jgi:hypothetical protein
MNLSLKEKKSFILIFSLTCFLIIFTLHQSFYKTSANGLRYLIEEEEEEKIKRCDKTFKDFKEEILKSPDNIEDKIPDELDKYQQILKDMIQEKKCRKITKYLPRILTYLIIAIVDIIFIIFWILFCCYSCKKVEKQNNIGCGAKCAFIIFFILCIVVIFLCAMGIIYFPYLTKSLNGLACSVYKLVFDFLQGTEKNEYIPWIGLNNILKNITNINSDNSYNDAIQNIKRINNKLNEINDNQLEDLEKILKKMDDLYPISSIVIFGGVGIFNLLGLLAMFLIFVCECKCMSCLFHLFWNIEIIFIIVTFFLSSILGTFSIASKDLSQILIYQKHNLSDIFNISEINNEIDICLNGNGNILSNILEDKEAQFYDDMNIQNKSLYNCSFFKIDYNILVGELDGRIKKKLYYVSLLLIIIDVVGIVSIFFGITIYNSQKEYYPPYTNNMDVNINNIRMMNNRVDISTENLKKQNNEYAFSKNIK